MKRFPHILRENKSTEICNRLVFYDTETKEVERDLKFRYHALKLGVAKYVQLEGNLSIASEKYKTFKTTNEFWDFVLKHNPKGTKIVLLSHNANFDFNVVNGFDELSKRGYKLKKFAVDSNLFFLKFKGYKRSIVVLDTFNYFKFSVEQLGQYLNLPKLKVNFETVSDEELETYCKRDVDIISLAYLNFIKFVKTNDLGNLGITLAQQGFNAFRHKFMKTKIYIHDNKEALELEELQEQQI